MGAISPRNWSPLSVNRDMRAVLVLAVLAASTLAQSFSSYHNYRECAACRHSARRIRNCAGVGRRAATADQRESYNYFSWIILCVSDGEAGSVSTCPHRGVTSALPNSANS